MAESDRNPALADRSGLSGLLAALGAVVIGAGRGFFGLFGGMSILVAQTATVVVRGLFLSGEQLGREAVAFQMVRVRRHVRPSVPRRSNRTPSANPLEKRRTARFPGVPR